MNLDLSQKVASPEKPKNFFHFGENWSQYLENCFDEKVLDKAIKSLEDFCGKDAIKGKTFVDIGCGSGLFSLAAYKLGAKSVLSLDIDENSVACCKKLYQSTGEPGNWEIIHGSILDDRFVESLGTFDFVYSWGVLHHTGNMWKAIENTTKLVKHNGQMYIAIYNNSDGFNVYPDFRFGNSYMWYLEKKIYSQMPRFVQAIIDYIAMSILIFFYIITFNNPIKKIKDHISFRGMDWKTDIIDWLGGYPYEYASSAEIFNFCKNYGLELENLISNNSLLNNEFLFRKSK